MSLLSFQWLDGVACSKLERIRRRKRSVLLLEVGDLRASLDAGPGPVNDVFHLPQTASSSARHTVLGGRRRDDVAGGAGHRVAGERCLAGTDGGCRPPPVTAMLRRLFLSPRPPVAVPYSASGTEIHCGLLHDGMTSAVTLSLASCSPRALPDLARACHSRGWLGIRVCGMVLTMTS